MERVLRVAFSALVGSKYAALVDARMAAAALIEDCERIARYHTELSDAEKTALVAALKECHEANRARNRVIHDAWAARPGNVMVTLRGRREPHDVTVTPKTPAEVRQVADRVADAADAVKAAMTSALGSNWPLVEDRLRQELGHDLGVD